MAGRKFESPFEAAMFYRRNGWMPIPVPFKSKAPCLEKWPTLHLNEDEIPTYFESGTLQNVGLLLGKPSGGLIDIDLDTPESRQLAE